jgi:arylsulfatase A-like enzyme
VSVFLTTQILLHVAFAGLTWVLACATATFSPTARSKFGRIVVGWFCVLAGIAIVYNALWYPRTLIGAYYHDAVAVPAGPWPIGQVAYFAAFGLCAVVLARGALMLFVRLGQAAKRRSVWALSAVVVLAAISLLWPANHSGIASASVAGQPNIIILGIDSLRLEQLRRFGGSGVTPNLDRFLARADLFSDTTTPAARTFSSWVAILTGRSPTVTGARFNLAERSIVSANPTIADVLRKAGYHTVYSTDEVRFANIDETYGFDQVVTPRIGASDFLIGTYNELPLPSLVINNRVGKWLFPFSYANRGTATMFDPETYVERLDWEVSFDQPTLFISHLTAAHWPYYTADTPFGVSTPVSEEDRPLYRIGLQTADRMFGEIMDMLEAKGALRNALVVVLSDHGEALGLLSDSFFDDTFLVEGMKSPLKMEVTGHGQSVLSKSQYQVLLGFRTFGDAREFGVEGREFKYPVTVEDIAPTILGFLGIGGNPLSATGESLLPMLESGSDGLDSEPGRIRFTETDLRVLPGPGGGVDEAGTARQNSVFFVVDPETARLHMRPAYVPLALAYKERAAFTRNRLIAAMPAGPYEHQYLFIDFAQHRGHLMLSRPLDDEPEAQRLWDAIHTHYEGELHKPVATTPADWPRITREWETFIEDRRSKRSSSPAAPVSG